MGGGTGADLGPARAAVAQGNLQGAADLHQPIVLAQPRNADALNLMGHVLRRSGNLGQAGSFYKAALAADPNRRGRWNTGSSCSRWKATGRPPRRVSHG